MKRISIWLPAMLLVAWLNTAHATAPIGPGDVLRISVFGNPDLSLEAKVADSGNVSFPLIGEVRIAGLSSAMAEKIIAERLEKGGFVRNPQVNIIVTLWQSQQVSVLGHVNRPGRYPVDGKRSLTDLLALAGGINQDGGDFVTVIRTREGKTTKDVVNLTEMLRSGDMSGNFDLTSNDVVFVDRAPRFYIYGEVQRPGFYRLEASMTILQALSTGGGLTARGTERGISIKRRSTTGKLEIIKVSHEDLVQVGDIVYVQESLF